MLHGVTKLSWIVTYSLVFYSSDGQATFVNISITVNIIKSWTFEILKWLWLKQIPVYTLNIR